MARKKTKRKRASPASFPGDRLIREIAQAMDRHKIGYVVIGGQAVNQHGHSRFTHDVDLTVRVAPWDAARVISVLTEAALSPIVPTPEQWVVDMHVLPCKHEPTGLGVDFSFVDSQYIGLAIERSVSFEIDGYPVLFLSVEDLFVHKVIANRPQDRIDVVELFNRHRSMDMAYVRHWLRQFEEVIEEKLLDRLDGLISESLD